MATPNEQATTEDFEFEALQHAVNYRNAIISEFLPELTGDVVEIGSGIGQFTEHLKRTSVVETLTCLEPDERFARRFATIHPDVNLIEKMAGQLPEDTAFDAAASVNVLEHIENDRKELKIYQQLLAPRQGHLCILVPARPEIFSPLDSDLGHFRRYTRTELSEKLRDAGFSIQRLHYFNFTGYLLWGLMFRIARKRGFNPDSVKLHDRLIFPVTKTLETYITRPPVGQSLIAIAKADA